MTTTTTEQETACIKFSAEEKHQLFTKWIEEIPDILEIIELGTGVNQEDFFSYFQAQMEALQVPGTLNHFQILDSLLPRFHKSHLSVENLQTAFIRLRNILILHIGKKNFNGKDTALKELVSQFDDLLSFLRTNYQMMDQFKSEELETETTLLNLPLPFLSFSGRRFENSFVANKKLLSYLPDGLQNPVFPDIWEKLIPAEDRFRLTDEFDKIYQERRNNYQCTYRLRGPKGEYFQVLEIGQIEYLDNSPVRISAFLIPDSLISQNELENNNIEASLADRALQAMGIGVLLCDSHGQIEKVLGSRTVFPSVKIEIVNHINQLPFGKDLTKKLDAMQDGDALLELGESLPENLDGKLHPLSAGKFLLLLAPKTASNSIDEDSKHLRNGLAFITAIQEELPLAESTQEVLDKMLIHAMELIPYADMGVIFRFSLTTAHISAARGLDISQLKNINLIPASSGSAASFVSAFVNRFSTIQIVTGTEFLNFLSKHVDAQKLRYLKRHFKLEEIPQVITVLLTTGQKPFGLLLLASHQEKSSFKEYHLLLLDYLLKIYGHHWFYRQKYSQQHQTQWLYKLIADNLDVPTLVINPQNIKWANSAWQKFGFKKISSPTPISEIFKLIGDDKDELRRKLDQTFSSGEQFFELPGRLASGIPGVIQIKMIQNKPEQLVLLQFIPASPDTKKEAAVLIKNNFPAETLPTKIRNMLIQLQQILKDANEDCKILENNPDKNRLRKLNKEIELAQKLLPYFKLGDNNGENVSENNLLLKNVIDELKNVLSGKRNEIETIAVSQEIMDFPVPISLGDLRYLLSHLKKIKFLNEFSNLSLTVQPIRTSAQAVKMLGIPAPQSIAVIKLLKEGFENSDEILPVKIKREEIPDENYDSFIAAQTRFGWYFYKLILNKQVVGLNILVPVHLNEEQYTGECESAPPGAILAVDDEKGIRDTFQALFNILGYPFYLAETGEEAKSIYREHSDKIDLVLLDYSLADTDGKTLLSELRQINPAIRVILCSGYSDQEGIAELMRLGVEKVLPKPFTIDMIKKALDEVFSG